MGSLPGRLLSVDTLWLVFKWMVSRSVSGGLANKRKHLKTFRQKVWKWVKKQPVFKETFAQCCIYIYPLITQVNCKLITQKYSLVLPVLPFKFPFPKTPKAGWSAFNQYLTDPTAVPVGWSSCTLRGCQWTHMFSQRSPYLQKHKRPSRNQRCFRFVPTVNWVSCKHEWSIQKKRGT